MGRESGPRSKKASRSRALHVVVAGVAVADVIGRPVDLQHPPKRGTLRLIDSITLTSGGIVSNVGIDLAKMGLRVGVITRVGSDALGDFLIDRYRTLGIDVEGVIVDHSAQTSATIASVDARGERTFLHTRGCMENFRGEDVLRHLSLVRRARILALGYLGLLPETEKELPTLLARIKERTGVKILLDSAASPRVSAPALRGFLPHVDYFIPSYQEAVRITRRHSPESIVEYLFELGAAGVLGVKLGARGCYVATRERGAYVPPVAVSRVVDATGAGDAFVAGFLAATLRGYDPFAAAAIGNRVAADCIQAVGASTAIRSLREYV